MSVVFDTVVVQIPSEITTVNVGTGVPSLPSGGVAPQVLTKASNNNYDAVWADPQAVPSNLGDLTDVVFATPPVADDVLVFNGTVWTNGEGGNTSPLTTKGDLYTFSTDNDRLPVGVNGQILVANSAAATGLAWANQYVTSGNLDAGNAASAYAPGGPSLNLGGAN